MSAILVRSRQGLDAVLADGARVARVCLAEDPQDQSIVRERSVATPHKAAVEVSVSTENDTAAGHAPVHCRDIPARQFAFTC